VADTWVSEMSGQGYLSPSHADSCFSRPQKGNCETITFHSKNLTQMHLCMYFLGKSSITRIFVHMSGSQVYLPPYKAVDLTFVSYSPDVK